MKIPLADSLCSRRSLCRIPIQRLKRNGFIAKRRGHGYHASDQTGVERSLSLPVIGEVDVRTHTLDKASTSLDMYLRAALLTRGSSAKGGGSRRLYG